MYNTEEARKTQRVLNMKDKIVGLAIGGSVERIDALLIAIEEAVAELNELKARGRFTRTRVSTFTYEKSPAGDEA